MLLLLSWLFYGLAASCVASLYGWHRSRRYSDLAGGTRPSFARVLGVAVAVFASIPLVDLLVQTRELRLAWMIPGCILLGGTLGWLASVFARRIALLARPMTWVVLNCCALAVGLIVTALATRQTALRWYAAAILGVVALLVARHFLSKVPPRWPLLFVADATLLAAVVAMPLVASGLDRLVAPAVADPTGGQPNILLVSVDTLRTDRLGPYGNRRARTPSIDALASTGALFEQATAPIAMTGPSHISILTGLYPRRHGATTNGAAIRGEVSTVAESLSEVGYTTAAFVSGWTLKDEATGLARRFDHYDDEFSRWALLPDRAFALSFLDLLNNGVYFWSRHHFAGEERRGNRTTDRALRWLSHSRNRPLFVMVHYFDPHEPYAPPPPYDALHDPQYTGALSRFEYRHPLQTLRKLFADPREVEHIKALYDGEISYADAEVGRLLQGLTDLELDEETFVIFTADHGESLGEHDFFFDHGEFLYDTCVRVPLILRFPDGWHAGSRWPHDVGLVDLAPTILELAGLGVPEDVDGKSLLTILEGREPVGQRTSFGFVHSGRAMAARSRYSARRRGFKLIWNFDHRELVSERPAREELYNLAADPGEQRNLSASEPQELEELRLDLREFMNRDSIEPSPVDGEVKERLRALGYL